MLSNPNPKQSEALASPLKTNYLLLTQPGVHVCLPVSIRQIFSSTMCTIKQNGSSLASHFCKWMKYGSLFITTNIELNLVYDLKNSSDMMHVNPQIPFILLLSRRGFVANLLVQPDLTRCLRFNRTACRLYF